MTASRLTHALESGALTLPPTGTIAVFRPPSETDLSALPADRVAIVHGFRPDLDAWAGRGFACAADRPAGCTAAIVFVPRVRALARALVADALAATGGGPVAIDGQKTDGIDSLARAAAAAGLSVSAALAKAHGKLFVVNGAVPDGWPMQETRLAEGFVTLPAAFSADAIDPASALLAGAIPTGLSGRIADLGAGWGYLSATALGRAAAITECHLIEAEHDALEAARRNIPDPRARFHWADARTFSDPAGFDHILMNPPFHESRRADPELGRAFIAAAARLLAPRGTLWMVANRHLPYEAALAAAFASVSELAGAPRFKLFRAQRPRKKAR